MSVTSSIDRRGTTAGGRASGSSDLHASTNGRARLSLARGRRARRGWLVRRCLLAADLLGLTLAFLLAEFIYAAPGTGRFGPIGELIVFLATLPCWVVVANSYRLYDRDEERADHSTADDVVGVVHLVTVGVWLLLAVPYISGLATPQLDKLITFWALAVFAVPTLRAAARVACRRSPGFQQATVIVGAGDVGQLIARKILKHPEYGLEIVGFIDDRPKIRRRDLPEHLTILGHTDELADIIERLDIERVVVSFSEESELEMLTRVRQLRGLDVQIDLVPRLFELIGPRVAVHMVEALPLIGLPPARLTPSSRIVKRVIDVVGAAVLLLATAPLFAYIALRIRLDSPGPILFRQTRLGLGMREFTALKFRTMKLDADPAVHRAYLRETMTAQAEAGANGIYKLDRSDVVTRAGRWLRRTSLDELPQLINVLRGDMSLVGPRPCIPYEAEHFNTHQLERFLVPQGLTGLWQVTARANSTFGEALDMDVAYVHGWSIGLDLRLLLRTPLALLRQRGATA
jgi:exopolysaccharide biosynthesis polyprenyl glycosylphosphotransferase